MKRFLTPAFLIALTLSTHALGQPEKTDLETRLTDSGPQVIQRRV